jgi:A/G-specific adenine glycosylase
LTAKNFSIIHKQLLSWYEKDARNELPWRDTSNIYHIYLSEVMLQQTQVSRVAAEYYPKFLERFPSFKALSKATLDEVFVLWSGLGYYRRAKNLHATAQLCPNGLPPSEKELQKLPGIGRYTASAICSFGYKQNVSVVDKNISRVLTRFFALNTPKEKEVWERADSFLNAKNPTEHNLALMDLGAMICTPTLPRCEDCPLAGHCLGKNNPDNFYKKLSKEYINKELHYALCIQNKSIAMVKSSEGMYKDMLELPLVEPHRYEDSCIGTFKHSVTHYKLKVFAYVIDEIVQDVLWVKLDEFGNAPISSLTQKAYKLYLESVK